MGRLVRKYDGQIHAYIVDIISPLGFAVPASWTGAVTGMQRNESMNN